RDASRLSPAAAPTTACRWEVVLYLHRDDCADARKRVRHHCHQCAVAQAYKPGHLRFRAVRQGDLLYNLDALQQSSSLLLGEDLRLAAVDHVLRPAHRMRRIDGKDLADDEPVEQHTDRGKMLLD